MLTRIVASTFCFFCFVSSASFINLEYSSSGQSIVDKSSNLEWLRLDNTFGMTVDQAIRNFGSEGWSIASYTQLDQLLSNVLDDYSRTNTWDVSFDKVTGEAPIVEFAHMFGYHIVSPRNAYNGSRYLSTNFYIGKPFVDQQVTNDAFASVIIRSSYDYIIPAHEYCYETDPKLPYTCVWIDDSVEHSLANIYIADPYPENYVANPLKAVALVRTINIPEPNLFLITSIFFVLLIAIRKRVYTSNN